jgi:Cd2+/Zn2+-exporting ATPase
VLLAPFGLVAIWLAVLADMGTSIAVTLNGLRLFDGSRKGH